jgi:hypothetical protein
MGFGGAAGGTLPVTRGALDARGASGGNNMAGISGGLLALGLASAGAQAGASIYGAKKAAGVQREGMKQAQANLERGRADAAKAYEAWQLSQAPVIAARKNALRARMSAMGIEPGEETMGGAATSPTAASPAVMASVREAPPPVEMFQGEVGRVPPNMGAMVPDRFVPQGEPVDTPYGRPVPMQTAELITGPTVPVPAPVPVGGSQPGVAPPVPQDYMPPRMGDLYG